MSSIIPGWDSVGAAARWHKGFEIAGFIALGLLLAFEILAYIYSNRESALLAAEQARLADTDTQQKKAREQETETLQSKVDAANAAAEKARSGQAISQQRIEELERAALPRRLSKQQEDKISSFLDKAPRGSLTINASVNADDARSFAEQLANLLTHKGWTVKINNSMFARFRPGPDPTGLWIVIKNPNTSPERAGALQQAFAAAGIVIRGEWDETLQDPEEVSLCIGPKPNTK
jgi:hypothetical protein